MQKSSRSACQAFGNVIYNKRIAITDTEAPSLSTKNKPRRRRCLVVDEASTDENLGRQSSRSANRDAKSSAITFLRKLEKFDAIAPVVGESTAHTHTPLNNFTVERGIRRTRMDNAARAI